MLQNPYSKILLFIILLISSLESFATNPLSGTYSLDTSIANSGTNFNSFNALQTHLNTYGISGSVIINVSPGVYNEQLELNNISGTSSTSSIIIQGNPNDSLRPTLRYSASSLSDDFIIKLSQVSHLTIRNMNLEVGDTMYGNIIDLNGGFNSYITFENDSLVTLPSYFASSNSWPIPVLSENFLTGPNHHLFFRNNYFFGGMTCFQFRAGNSLSESSITIENNEIIEWRNAAIYIEDYDNVIIKNNSISGQATYGGDGIIVTELSNSEIIENDINLNWSGNINAIKVEFCTEFKVLRNKIITNSNSGDNTGVLIWESEGTSQNRSLIANNMISIETHTYTHPWPGRDYAIGIHAYKSSYTDYVNNSILTHGDSAWSAGIQIELPSNFSYNSTSNYFYNNNIVNKSKGFTIYANYTWDLDGVSDSDFNNYFTNGGNFAEYGSTIPNFQQWKIQTGFDNTSINYDPNYPSNTDLHIHSFQLDGAGKVLSFLTNDYDLEPRSPIAPDIGADEYFVCPPPSSLSLDSLNSRYAQASWTSTQDSTFWTLSNLATGQDTSSYSRINLVILDWLDENSSYELKIWHNCIGMGMQSDTISISFTTPSCPIVEANFTYTNSFLALNFDGSSSLGRDSVSWTIGDTTFNNILNPQFTFDSAGFYLVKLEVFNFTCLDTSSIDSIIQVCDSVQSLFTYSKNNLSLFANSQSINADSLQWYFGDGNSANGLNVQHTYSQEGQYQLMLISFNPCNESDTLIQNVVICDTSVASFTYQVVNQDTSYTYIKFDGSNSIGANSFIWDFGDGSFDSTNLSPLHLYPSGTYNFTTQLTVLNLCGDSNSSIESIHYFDQPEFLTKPTFHLYPNPNNGKFTLNFPKDLHIKITIRDYTGKGLFHYHPTLEEVLEGSILLDVSFLGNSRFYTVEVSTPNSSKTFKVINQ